MRYIRYEEKSYGGVLTISRPRALNALNSQVLEELEEALKNLEGKNLKCLVITRNIMDNNIVVHSTSTKHPLSEFFKTAMMK